MSHIVRLVEQHGSIQTQMLVKYETCPNGDTNSVPKTRMKICSRFVAFICILLGLLLVYLPIFYPPVFGHKSFDVIVDGWSVNTSRSLPMYIAPLNDTTVISDRTFCAEPRRLLIVVASAVGNFPERAAIRQTWANFSSGDYQVVFLLGQTENLTVQETVEAEAVVNRDIIQEGFIDSYNNLTLKSVMLLKQVVARCSRVEFVLKTDDDMFVHVENLLRVIRDIQDLNIKNLLLGELICDAKPIQDTTSKWYSPTYMFDGKVYPKYLSGTGYLMDRSAAIKLYAAALVTPFFHLEDVYITGFCAKKADVKPRDHTGFTYQTRPLDPCLYMTHKFLVTSHRVTPDKMRLLWAALHTNRTCNAELRSMRAHSPRLHSTQRKNSRC